MRYTKLKLSDHGLKSQLEEYCSLTTAWEHVHGFDLILVPSDLLNACPFMSEVKSKFNASPIIFKMNPNTFYRFHIDATRKCAINMLISGKQSHCYFGSDTIDPEVTESVEELIYEDSYYYLLNTREKHAVLNLNNYRYILSIGFNDHSYEEIKKYCDTL